MFSTEDSYDGSGSGSGAGDDDDDDPNGGSGLGSYDYSERVPGHTDHSSTASGSSSTSSPTHYDDPTTTTSNGGEKNHKEYDDRENEVNPHDRKKGSESSGSRLGNGMSLRQAMLTYMLPIYMAWFGGLLCDLF